MTGPIWGTRARAYGTIPPKKTTVVIIGGGVTGLSAAYWLYQRKIDFVLLEKSTLCAGATGRNAGFLLTGVAANYAAAAQSYGRTVAGDLWNLTIDNHALLRELVTGANVAYTQLGSWTLAASNAEATALQESAAMLHEDRLPGEWRESIDDVNPYTYGGLFTPADGVIHPVHAMDQIATLLPHESICEGIAVTSVSADSSGVSVHYDGREIHGEFIILATNGYTQQIIPPVGIEPIRAQMLATIPSHRIIARHPIYADYGYQYWRQLADGCVLIGGYRNIAMSEEIGCDATPTPRIQHTLEEHARSLGVDQPVSHRWAGIMGFTPDFLPLIGPVTEMPHTFICGGFSGHGMGLAVRCSQLLVNSIADGSPIPPWLLSTRLVNFFKK